MAEMGIASRAENLNPFDQKSMISGKGNIGVCGRSPKARPPGAGFKLLLRSEQCGAATDTVIEPAFMIFPVASSECTFGALLASNRELFSGQDILPLSLRLYELASANC